MKVFKIDTKAITKKYHEVKAELDRRQKIQDEDSAKHNHYIDRPHYHYLCDRTNEKRLELHSIWNFISDYFVFNQVLVKKGCYSFTKP